VLLVILATRLKEPIRGWHERRAVGADHERALVEQPPVSARVAIRQLAQIPTIRRIWYAAPFLAIALFGIPTLLSLVYEDVFGLDAGQRGLIAAAIEPLQIVGVVIAMPVMSRLADRGSASLLRFVAVVGIIDGLLVVALAHAPHVSLAITVHALLAGSVGTLAPAFLALVSLVAPPHIRSATFSTISVAAVPGIALFLPVIGAVSDAIGMQASMLALVPICVAGALLLASATGFVDDDVTAVRFASVTASHESIDERDGATTAV
jgi:branched-chain amino acid transport system ATP-binding protein